MVTSDILYLPGDAEYEWTLGNRLPPCPLTDNQVFIARAGSGLLEPANPEQMQEYLMGGEYDDRLAEIPIDEEEECMEDLAESDINYVG